MSHYNDTVRTLSEITDTGLFEHLATAVLRGAKPELYGNLTQPGVNAEGKAVKSPVDAISFVAGANPRHMVTAHHTICLEDDLGKKWLHDPSKVTSRKGTKSVAPAGDVVKTAVIANDERRRTPNLQVTLALTTNKEPTVDVTREAERVAHSYGIVLDIWSRSRIADHLDNSPDGQWLRRKYLNIEQERLSRDLLRELSQRSLAAHQPMVEKVGQVARDGARAVIESLTRPVGFLVGESGFGKSVACYQYLARHIEHGACGLVLPHEVLASSITLDQAVDAALRQFHPALAYGSGATACSLCSADSPLLIVVEDISRSGQSAYLIERLVRWATSLGNEDRAVKSAWRLICPVWPELFGALGDETRKHVEPMAARLGPFTPMDAREVVLKRAALEGVDISVLDADAISEALGYDPLLIGLRNLKSDTPPKDIIATFITGCTDRLARDGTRAASEYAVALRSLAGAMLQRRQVDPAWSDVLTWFNGSPDQLTSLRELAKYGEAIRVAGSAHNSRLGFRHDRVRKWLLTDAAIYVLREQSLDEAVFAEPFFADVIGAAFADPSIAPPMAERARLSNPLALFHALHSFRESSTQGHDVILAAINSWLSDDTSHTRAHQSLRYAALHVLSATQSSHVVPMLALFRDRSWTGPLAGLRNGSLKSGLQLCYSLEPGSDAEWRDRAIEHAKARFGPALISELNELLRRPGLKKAEIIGGLRLAGHLAEISLAEAIGQCWNSDQERGTRLAEYLWAAAQCGGEQTEQLLSPVCDAWAALPDKAEKEGHSSPRDDLAADQLAWAFWRRLPTTALTYFIQRAARDDLCWPITYMLRGVDHPDAVAFIANEFAERARKGAISFVSIIDTVWSRRQREQGRSMSLVSRTRLHDLWANAGNDIHLRKQSIRLWAATSHIYDLPLLQSQDSTDLLADELLRARLERIDKTAIPLLVEKIRGGNKNYWWQFARAIWSDELTSTLDEQLSLRSKAFTPVWGAHWDGDWIMSELLVRREPSVAEGLLCKHWNHLRFSPSYVQAALYVGSPRLRELVRETISECPSPLEMFKHIDSHFGIKTFGHPGVTRIEQVEGLIPYLDHLDEFTVYHFWELCNERGWMNLRREHLDARLGKWRKNAGLDDETLFAELDQELTHDVVHSLDYWVERHLGNGRSIENLLGIVQAWLKSNRTAKALEVAASIVIHAGSRGDIDLLNEGSDQSELAAEIIADARFAVRRRTLS